MDRDDTHGAGSCRATSSDQYGGTQGRTHLELHKTRWPLTSSALVSLMSGLLIAWSRWHLMGVRLSMLDYWSWAKIMPGLAAQNSPAWRPWELVNITISSWVTSKRWGDLSPMVGCTTGSLAGRPGT